MSTPITPPRRIPGPVPKPDDHTASFYSHVTDGPIDSHRIHNSTDEGDAPPIDVVDSPPPPLAPSPFGTALPAPAEPISLPPEPMMPDMMDASALGGGAEMGAEMGEEGGIPQAPLVPPDGGPPPSNPAEDFLLRGLLEGAGMRKQRPLGQGR